MALVPFALKTPTPILQKDSLQEMELNIIGIILEFPFQPRCGCQSNILNLNSNIFQLSDIKIRNTICFEMHIPTLEVQLEVIGHCLSCLDSFISYDLCKICTCNALKSWRNVVMQYQSLKCHKPLSKYKSSCLVLFMLPPSNSSICVSSSLCPITTV